MGGSDRRTRVAEESATKVGTRDRDQKEAGERQQPRYPYCSVRTATAESGEYELVW